MCHNRNPPARTRPIGLVLVLVLLVLGSACTSGQGTAVSDTTKVTVQGATITTPAGPPSPAVSAGSSSGATSTSTAIVSSTPSVSVSGANSAPIKLGNPAFVTPSGTQCLNTSVFDHTANNLVDPYQSTTCFQPNYHGIKLVNQQCMDLLIFNITLDPTEDYPRPSGCIGDNYPFGTNPGAVHNPYQAKVGDIIDLGPTLCQVAEQGVTCKSKAHAGQMRFTLSPTTADVPVRSDVAGPYVADQHAASTPVVASARQFTLSGDSSFQLTNVKVTSSTTRSETGTAMLSQNTCQPTCADANYKNTTIKFTLDKPQLTICAGKLAFEEHFFYSHISYATPVGQTQTFAFGAPNSLSPADRIPNCYSLPASN